jgi:tRNA uridine 5-carbamoylmethylation protein Kti12
MVHHDGQNTIRQPTVVVLVCGLPGSGKSLLCQKIRDIHGRCQIIEYDAIENALLANQTQTVDASVGRSATEEETNETTLTVWRQSRSKALQQLKNSLIDRDHSLILLDDNFYLTSMRKQCFKVCQHFVTEYPAAAVTFGTIHVQTSLEISLMRNREREAPVPDSVVIKMADRFEAPDSQSNTFEHSCLSFTDSDQVEFAIDFIKGLFNFNYLIQPIPDPAVEADRVAMEHAKPSASIRHQVDLFLRECVQEFAQICPENASLANRIRKNYIKQEIVCQSTAVSYFLDSIERESEKLIWSGENQETLRSLLVTKLQK